MIFSDLLEPYRTSSLRYLDLGRISELSFSGSTYQVGVEDLESDELFWVFVQLGERDIKDIFCNCSSSTETGACEHMAAAYRYIYRIGDKPLHSRFEDSAIKAVFLTLFSRLGGKNPKIVKKDNCITVKTSDDTVLYSIKVKEKGILPTLIFERKEETEENSIKFSNLTEEELDAWRKGMAPFNLRAELSFFQDIAKQLFLHDDPEFVFTEDEKGVELPSQLTIESKTATFELQMDRELLTAIIPKLDSIHHTNLDCIHSVASSVESIHYVPKEHHFIINYKKTKETIPEQAPIIDNYAYVHKQGFVVRDLYDKIEEIIRQSAIPSFLDKRMSLLKRCIPELTFDDTFHPIQYQISFDAKKTLRIEAYLFVHGDLTKGNAHHFGDWVYIDQKGFYRTESLKFKTVKTSIGSDQIGQFLLQNRHFLNRFAGFYVHIAKMEEEIVYRVSKDDALIFHAKIDLRKKIAPTYEFNDWIYCRGHGFFLKETKAEKSPTFIFDQPIAKGRVSDFILRHIDIISTIPNFFTLESPVVSMGLKISLQKGVLIEIEPEYTWADETLKKESIFFDEFIYLPEKGFYRLPPHFRSLYFSREIRRENHEGWNKFFLEDLPKLKNDLPCNVDPKLEIADVSSLVIKSMGQDDTSWQVDLDVAIGTKRVAVKHLISAKKRGDRFVPTEAGVVDLQDDRFHFLSMLVPKVKSKKGDFLLTSVDIVKLQAYETIILDDESAYTSDEQKVMLERLLDKQSFEPPSYTTLQGTLRAYQRIGVEWLYFLYQNRLSGILADDMGVGKTHQAMGLIAAITEKKAEKKELCRFLIVCPTSLVYHWQDKIAAFLPHLKVGTYITSQRIFEEVKECDVLLTTYGIFRSEVEKFTSVVFDLAIFDELQIAKNHVSQIHTALCSIKAEMRLGLTGTPIENQLRELKAVFDIVLPGYMPDETQFREYFIRPIERESSDQRKRLLSKLVQPFILRRKKQDVLPDLPAKIEEFCYTELVGEQKALYRSVAALQAATLLQQLEDSATPIPYMHIFALLTALKQICNHPAAYLKDVENYSQYESGKWDLFVELMEEAEESGLKVVVFSQYLSMLDIIALHLKKRKIGYAQIRGATRHRGEEVARFQNDPDCRVFLGSLRAAGLGIDLTAAQVVIHYDRWWNPAIEGQATDRVHRIGQQHGIEVMKLITKHSIEEHIDSIIRRKQGLLEDIISFDDQHVVKRLSRDELKGLLQELKATV